MTPTQANIRCWWDEDCQAYRFSSPYNKQFVDLMTAAVPFSERSWDPQSKIWTITEKVQPAFVQLAEKVFKTTATVVTKSQAQSASSASTSKKDINEVIVEFVKLLPHEAALKAYRTAAMLLHPDRGGDMTKMAKINAAWTRMEKEVYGK